jgi:hypothetical protein
MGKIAHDQGPYQIAIKGDADEADAVGSLFLFGCAVHFSSDVLGFGSDLCSAVAGLLQKATG